MSNIDIEDDPREVIPMRIIEEVSDGDEVITYYNIIHKDGKYWWEHDDVIYGSWNNIADAIDSAVQSLTDTDGL